VLKNIEINPEFKMALDLMENSYKNLFLTGRAVTKWSRRLKCSMQANDLVRFVSYVRFSMLKWST
jgi:hypothetical protein